MSAAYFQGWGLHTTLAAGVPSNVDALFGPLPTPSITTVALNEGPKALSSFLLRDTPLGNPRARLWSAIGSVLGEAIEDAGLSAADLQEAALLIGTSSFDISVSEAEYVRELSEGHDAHALSAKSSMGALSHGVRERFGVGGPDFTFNTACTSSANAVIYADALIRTGRVRHAIVLGVELFNVVTALGFNSLGLLAPLGMKPFDAERGGLVPGESCAALVLGPHPRAAAPFRLVGSGNLCDTYGVSSANPDGSSVAEVIRIALEAADLAPGAIAGVKAHGSASLMNDEGEAAGMQSAFGVLPPICALKPFIGHTFGACGLSELILFCGLSERGLFPGAPGVCVEPSDLGIRLAQTPETISPGFFMLNYFGFGGNNTSLVLSNVEQ